MLVFSKKRANGHSIIYKAHQINIGTYRSMYCNNGTKDLVVLYYLFCYTECILETNSYRQIDRKRNEIGHINIMFHFCFF